MLQSQSILKKENWLFLVFFSFSNFDVNDCYVSYVVTNAINKSVQVIYKQKMTF